MSGSGLHIPRLPRPGEVVDDKYVVLRIIGEGGMGTVVAAEHLRLRQHVAIKFLNPQLMHVAQIVERFDREARAAATLRSPHVARVTDVEHTAEGVPYMVMELLEGVDLETERVRRTTLPFPEVVDYVLQACGALAEAHEAGIVHRDLKPGNLFLAQDTAVGRVTVKVLDFGISKFLKDDDVKLTSAGAVIGTALYMSPEQIRGDASIDARSDIWSLGVILYELITGEAPWTGPSTRIAAMIVSAEVPDIRKRTDVPPALAATIHAMLAKSAAHRPSTIRDVAAALAPFAPPGSIGAEVAELVRRRSPESGRRLEHVTTPPSAPSPERYKLVVSSTAMPERSTMAATITSAAATAPTVFEPPRGRGRAIAGVAVAATVMIGLAVVATMKLGASKRPVAAASAEASTSATATAVSSVASVTSVPASAAPESPPPAPVTSARPAAAGSGRKLPSARPAPSPPHSAPPGPAPAPKPTTTAPPLFLQ